MYVVDLTVADVSWLGRAKPIPKTDQEVSLMAFVTQTHKAMKFKIADLESSTTEHGVKYEN